MRNSYNITPIAAFKSKGRLLVVFATVIAAAALLSSANAAPPKSGGTSLEDRCPTAMANLMRLQQTYHSKRPSVAAPRDPALRNELLRMSQLDQMARMAAIKQGLKDSKSESAIDAENLKNLKRIFEKHGFPTPEMVGYDGMNAAWLLLQHADEDPAWQRKWLGAIERLFKRNELDAQGYALFVDRVRVNEGRKQIYGSQFKDVAGRRVRRPTVDPARLDERRKAIGLIPENDYECMLSAMYDR